MCVVLISEAECRYNTFGAVMPGRSFSSDGYRCGFNGKEKDNEIKNIEGSSLDFGARIYDPRLGRWFALDPLKMVYPSLSPFQYSANSPIALNDPDGRWIPGFDPKTNTITFKKETGDNYYTFTQFLGMSDFSANMKRTGFYSNINLVTSYRIYKKMQNSIISTEPSMLKYMTASLTDANNSSVGKYQYPSNPNDPNEVARLQNYNCWTSAIKGTSDQQFQYDEYNEMTGSADFGIAGQFESAITKGYTSVDQDKAGVGKTVLRFGKDVVDNNTGNVIPNVTTHGAIYMGKDSDGNLYAYTKNGWNVKPEIVKLAYDQKKGYYIPGLEDEYGYIKGVNQGETGFYNSKKTTDLLGK